MNQEQYQRWLDSRGEALEQLARELDESTREALDFTPQSLHAAGAYLVEHFPSLAELHRVENRSRHLGFSTYAFEVFRRHLHLQPRLPQDDPRYEYFGVPVLHRPGGPDISPFHLVTFTVHRHDAGLLAKVFENQRGAIPAAGESTSPSGGRHPSLQPMSEDEFNTWLTFLTDRLDELFDSLDERIRRRLDLSPASLKALGELAVSELGTASDGHAQDRLLGDLCSYVAEVFHRNLGLQLFLPEQSNEPAFGQPSIRDASGATISIPQLVVETARRRESELLLETFNRIRDGWVLSEGGAKS